MEALPLSAYQPFALKLAQSVLNHSHREVDVHPERLFARIKGTDQIGVILHGKQ